MAPRPNQLNDDQRLEYQQLGEFARHDDTVNLTVSSLLLPALIAALGWAWLNHGLVGPLALGSLVVWLYWSVVNKRRNDFLNVRFARAWELEKAADFRHHLAIKEADDQQKGSSRWVRIKLAERLASSVLFGAWLWLIFASLSPPWLAAGLIGVAIVAFAPLLNREPTKEGDASPER
jgi:Flp pilus assembly protein TadB